MTAPPSNLPRPAASLLGLAALTFAAAAFLALIGYFPTSNLAGPAGVAAMFTALAITIAATLAGLIPPVLNLQAEPLKRHNAVLAGMALRLLAAGLLTAAVAFSDIVAWRPLVLWVALSYLGLLAVDVIGLVRLLKRAEESTACPS